MSVQRRPRFKVGLRSLNEAVQHERRSRTGRCENPTKVCRSAFELDAMGENHSAEQRQQRLWQVTSVRAERM